MPYGSKFGFVAVSACRRFGVSPFWCVAILVCRRFGVSPFWCVVVLVCRHFGVSPFWCVAVLVCRRFGCHRCGFVAVLTRTPIFYLICNKGSMSVQVIGLLNHQCSLDVYTITMHACLS